MVNYYELLEIPQTAERVVIEQAIKKTRRLWNNRANSPDSAIRAEAEQHVREVAEAERILLDESKREEYNRQLATSSSSTIDRSSERDETEEDWEDEYFNAYNRDMNDYAAQIAQRAISRNDRDGRAWFLYGEALRKTGNLNQAISALQRAAYFLNDSDMVYRQLFFAYSEADMISEALDAINMAVQNAPNNAEYYTLRAELFRSVERIYEALAEASRAYSLDPKDDSVRFTYFATLYEAAMKAMSYNRSSGRHLITNKVQLDYVNGLLQWMALTIPEDVNKAKCMQKLDEVVEIVADAESMKGGFFKKIGYEYNYSISNDDTRSSGRQ